MDHPAFLQLPSSTQHGSLPTSALAKSVIYQMTSSTPSPAILHGELLNIVRSLRLHLHCIKVITITAWKFNIRVLGDFLLAKFCERFDGRCLWRFRVNLAVKVNNTALYRINRIFVILNQPSERQRTVC